MKNQYEVYIGHHKEKPMMVVLYPDSREDNEALLEMDPIVRTLMALHKAMKVSIEIIKLVDDQMLEKFSDVLDEHGITGDVYLNDYTIVCPAWLCGWTNDEHTEMFCDDSGTYLTLTDLEKWV